jgi:hypothetical protein
MILDTLISNVRIWRKNKRDLRKAEQLYIRWQQIYLEIIRKICWAQEITYEITPVKTSIIIGSYVWINRNTPYEIPIPIEWLNDNNWELNLKNYLVEIQNDALIEKLSE